MIFSVLSFHVALFPTLNIIPHSAITLVSMRWLYFSMAFLSLACVQVIRRSLKLSLFITIGVLCPMLVYIGSYSYLLNSSLWMNEERFFRQEVLGFQNYYYAGGLADKLLDKKAYQEAERLFQIAIKNYPREASNYLNYSALLTETGRPRVALATLKNAKTMIKSRRRKGQWNNNSGVAYFQLKNYTKALGYFMKAVIFCSDNVEYQTNLGSTHAANGNYAKGALVLEKTLAIAPDSVALRKNLALIYIQMKKYENAMTVLKGFPETEWGKKGIKELFEQTRAGLLRSDEKAEREL